MCCASVPPFLDLTRLLTLTCHTAHLQDSRTIRKIAKLDDHITIAFAGFTADARVLISKARLEAQSYRLTCEDSPSVEYMAKYIAKTQQSYTQRGGVRPFGVSSMLAGFTADGHPQVRRTCVRVIFVRCNTKSGTIVPKSLSLE